jgi:hypothetical protein
MGLAWQQGPLAQGAGTDTGAATSPVTERDHRLPGADAGGLLGVRPPLPVGHAPCSPGAGQRKPVRPVAGGEG